MNKDSKMDQSSTSAVSTKADYPVPFDRCEAQGGHCFERINITLTSNPPQYPEVCRHCGARRVGTPQKGMSYSEVQPPL